MADALNEIGVTEVFEAAFADRSALLAAEANATFDSHNYAGATIAVADGNDIAGLAAGAIAEVADTFNLDAAPNQIFAFGIGRECSLVGLNRSFKVAPVHTPGEGAAATTYSRYAILVGYETGGEAFYIGMTPERILRVSGIESSTT